MTNRSADDYLEEEKGSGNMPRKSKHKNSNNAKQKLKKKVKKTVEKVIKKIAQLVVKFVVACWPYILIFLAVLALLGLVFGVMNWFNAEETMKQKFADLLNDTNSDFGYQYGENNTDDIITGALYDEISEKSYYITIEDELGQPIENGKIWQSGTEEWKEFQRANQVIDIDGRENQFALSGGVLAILDSELNNGFMYPEQFLKPVYSDCITGEQKDYSKCQLLDLLNEDGLVNAKSRYFAYRPAENVKGSEPSGDFIENMDEPSNTMRNTEEKIYFDAASETKTLGLWDWGLGSLIHYKRFQQDSKIDQYRIKTYSKWDEDSKTLIDGELWDNLTKTQREETVERYGIVIPNVSFSATAQDILNAGVEYAYTQDRAEEYKNLIGSNAPVERLSPSIPETEVKYAITGAVTYLGGINNKPYQAFIDQGTTTSTAIVLDHEEKYGGLSEQALRAEDWKTDPKGNKVIRLVQNGSQVAELNESNPHITFVKNKLVSTDEQCVNNANLNASKPQTPGIEVGNTDPSACEVREDGYEFGDGWYQGDEGSFSFERAYFMDIEYLKEGTLFTNTVIYASSEPDTTNVKGFDYLENYIDNYRAFIPTSTGQEVSKCYQSEGAESLNIDTWASGNIDEDLICNDSSITMNTNGFGLMKPNLSKLSQIHYQLILSALGMPNEKGETQYDDDGEVVETGTQASILEFNPNNFEIEDNGIANAINGAQGDFLTIESEYGQMIKKSAVEYGISYPLLLAIAKQESGGNHNGNISESACASGCGLMQIENPVGNPREITAYNFNKRENATLQITFETMKDAKFNIQAAAMILQELLIKYNYNTLMAIQAYNFGEGALNAAINLYSQESGFDVELIKNNPSDIGWTKYRKEIYINPVAYISGASATGTWGDYQYIEHILRYTGMTPFRFQNATDDPSAKHTIVTFLPLNLIEGSINSTSIVNAMQSTLKSAKASFQNSSRYENNMLLLTSGQKNSYSGVFELSNEGMVISEGWLNTELHTGGEIEHLWENQAEKLAYIDVLPSYYNDPIRATEEIIAKMFAFDQGSTIDLVLSETEDIWKGRYAQLFSTSNSKKWSSSVDMEQYIEVEESGRVFDEDYTIKKHFGYIKNHDTNEYYSNKETLFLAKPLITKVHTFNDGVVVDLQDSEDISVKGKTVTVEYNTGSKTDVMVEVQYSNLENVLVNPGQAVKTDNVLGNVGLDGMVGIRFLINGVENDFEMILNATEDSWRYKVGEADGFMGLYGQSGYYDPSFGYMNKDWLENPGYMGNYSPTGNWNLSDFVDTSSGRISAGTWFYPNGKNTHDALDWATPVGASIYAPSDIVVLNTNDSCAHSNSGKNWNTDCNNFVFYLMQNGDGNVYSIKISHMQQGSISNAGWISSGTQVSKGTVLGKTGNSGYSTGPHAHFRINKLGNEPISNYVSKYLSSKNETFGTGYAPIRYSSRCEEGASAPCVEAPDVLFTGGHF